MLPLVSCDDNEQVDLDRRLDRVMLWGPVLLCALALIELAGRLSVSSGIQSSAGQTVSPSVSIHFAGTDSSGLTWPGVVIVVLLCAFGALPLAFLRPVAAATLVSISCVCSLVFYQVVTVGGLVAVLAAGYLAGRYGRSWLVGGAVIVPYVVLALAGPPGAATRDVVVLLASLGPACVVLGIARRRSEIAAGAASEAIAGTVFSHMARAERARIARELHDVVAHHISMVAVQAETARLATPGMPELGARRLREIGDTARAGLTEMRRLLGVLREDAAEADPPAAAPASSASSAAALRPQPGLSLTQLNELLDSSRTASGAATRLIVSGPVTGLDPGVELAAYRIVQEALTNSRRHAPGAAVDVELRYGHDALLLRIRDNGAGSQSPGPVPAVSAGMTVPASAEGGGHGLVGMRERAQAAGGSLRAGPAAGGGFLVQATFPMPDARDLPLTSGSAA
jgi:signal transduction histidine kinase